MRYSVVVTLLLVGLLLVAAFAPLGTVLGTPANEVVDTTSGESPLESAVVDTSLASTSGTVEVVVRFAEADRQLIASQADPVAALHAQADSSQDPLLRYASARPGVTITDRFWIANAVVLEVDTERVSLAELAAVDGVERIHPNFEIQTIGAAQPVAASDDAVSPASTVTSASTSYTYGLEQIGAPQVWNEYETRGAGATVAVLDSGVDTAGHSDLAVAPGGWADFVAGQSTPYDDNGHGTHVSGTIVGDRITDPNHPLNNAHYGVAPDAELLHGKVMNESGSGNFATLLNGMEWAVDHPAEPDVLTMSLGAPWYATDFIEPVQNARASGLFVVAASGNSGAGTSNAPANIYDAVSVGASDGTGAIAEFSSGETVVTEDAWGANGPTEWPAEYVVPSVSAPGVNVASAWTDGNYDYESGTSMATPHVAGVAALMQSATSSSLSHADIESALVSTAWKPAGEPTGQDERYGHGIIDAYGAVTVVVEGEATAQIDLTDASLSPSTILEGESTTVTATFENSGTATGQIPVELQVNGSAIDEQSVTLAPGEEESVTFTPTFDERGAYEIAVNGQVVDLLRVDRPATFETGSLSVTPDAPVVSESLTVSLSVTNTGDRGGTYTGAFSVDGEQIDSSQTLIEPTATETVSFTTSFDQAGSHTVSIGAAEPVTVFVTDPDDSLAAYRSDDGSVQTTGLRAAIADWRANEISTDVLREAIAAWRQR